MKSWPGTYAFVLKNHVQETAQIGRWGKLDLRTGFYIYVGSALGPGGVHSRVSRHISERKNKHWHIDYLRDFCLPYAVIYSYSPVGAEHKWAETLKQIGGLEPVIGFGCSDCDCLTHLFFSGSEPKLDSIAKAFHGKVRTFNPSN